MRKIALFACGIAIIMAVEIIILFLSGYNNVEVVETTVETTLETSTEETVEETIVEETVEEEATEGTTIETIIEETTVEETIEEETVEEVEPTFLLQIDNPDYTYTSYPIILSDYDREQLAHLVMGEFGTGGFVGCALIAQSVRDAMVKFGYTSIDEVIVEMQYSGWYSGQPSDFVYEAIDYIFTEGKAAVQHEILVMYATKLVYSSWHEAQEFVVEYQYVRFFDY